MIDWYIILAINIVCLMFLWELMMAQKESC